MEKLVVNVLWNMESNDDRCKIFQATFRIFPELASRQLYEAETRSAGYPLDAILNCWPNECTIPIELLDQLAENLCAWQFEAYNASIFKGLKNVLNREEVALWAIQHKIGSEGLKSAIQHSFPVEVVIAAVESVAAAPFGAQQCCESGSLRAAGPYWDETLLRLLWRNSMYCDSYFDVNLDINNVPKWFIDMVADDTRIQRKFSISRRRPYCGFTMAGPVITVTQHSATLTEWHLSSDDSSDQFVALLLPESLETMMSTARDITIAKYTIEFPELDEERKDLPPDCFEGWAKGLVQNSRIDHLKLFDPFGMGNFRVCGSGFIRALCSRPKVEQVVFVWYDDEDDEDLQGKSLKLDTEDMLDVFTTNSLESILVCKNPPIPLESVLGMRPVNLRGLALDFDANFSSEDFQALSDFLAHPECKLKMFSDWRNELLWNDSFDSVDLKLTKPARSFVNVPRDHNSTLTLFPRFKNIPREEQEAINFLCEMNKTCPNRLKLRQELSDAYADQIAKYTNHYRYSEAFELIRSTFHFVGTLIKLHKRLLTQQSLAQIVIPFLRRCARGNLPPGTNSCGDHSRLCGHCRSRGVGSSSCGF